jgi:hypothetical protein
MIEARPCATASTWTVSFEGFIQSLGKRAGCRFDFASQAGIESAYGAAATPDSVLIPVYHTPQILMGPRSPKNRGA